MTTYSDTYSLKGSTGGIRLALPITERPEISLVQTAEQSKESYENNKAIPINEAKNEDFDAPTRGGTKEEDQLEMVQSESDEYPDDDGEYILYRNFLSLSRQMKHPEECKSEPPEECKSEPPEQEECCEKCIKCCERCNEKCTKCYEKYIDGCLCKMYKCIDSCSSRCADCCCQACQAYSLDMQSKKLRAASHMTPRMRRAHTIGTQARSNSLTL